MTGSFADRIVYFNKGFCESSTKQLTTLLTPPLSLDTAHLGPLDPAVLDEGVPADLHRDLLGRGAVLDEAALPVSRKLVSNGWEYCNHLNLSKVRKVCNLQLI